MTRPKTVEQKIGEWQRAYTAVLDEMIRSVPPDPVPVKADPKADVPKAQEGWFVTTHETFQIIEGPIIADRRTAAIVAAMLVGQNVRVPVDGLGSTEGGEA